MVLLRWQLRATLYMSVQVADRITGSDASPARNVALTKLQEKQNAAHRKRQNKRESLKAHGLSDSSDSSDNFQPEENGMAIDDDESDDEADEVVDSDDDGRKKPKSKKGQRVMRQKISTLRSVTQSSTPTTPVVALTKRKLPRYGSMRPLLCIF